MIGRKRVYGGRSGFSRPFKKTKYSSRRRYTGKKTRSYTGRNVSGSSVRFGGRKLPRRAWKRSLFTHSRHMSHYRTTDQVSNNVSSSINQSLYKTNMLDAMNLNGTPFWKAAGGLQPLDDLATTDPQFTGNIIIRGGTLAFRFYHPETGAITHPINIFVALLKVRKSNIAISWPVDETKGIGWDFTMEADFAAKYGKIIFMTKKTLLPGDQFVVERKIPITEVDQEVYRDTGLYKWFFGLNDPNGSGYTIPINRTFNMSISGDATVRSEPS